MTDKKDQLFTGNVEEIVFERMMLAFDQATNQLTDVGANLAFEFLRNEFNVKARERARDIAQILCEEDDPTESIAAARPKET